MPSLKIESDDGSTDGNDYGWGTRINLSDDQVEALGLNTNPPKIGSLVGLQCIAQVVEVVQSVDVDEDGDKADISLCLQITDMSVEGAITANVKNAASMLYGDS